MLASVFVGTSVDGFMARLNSDFDFLTAGGESEEHGYEEFIATIDAIVMGRGTFEKVLTFDKWPYGSKRVVVLSSRPLDLTVPRARGAVVEQMVCSPAEIVSRLEAQDVGHIYVDGGVTIQRFLRAGLIQRITISRLPVLIGTGIPLFGQLDADIRLEHVATRQYKGGMVQTEYKVLPQGIRSLLK